jgi:Tfp pilus assembly pilus retraction ATPase PilT
MKDHIDTFNLILKVTHKMIKLQKQLKLFEQRKISPIHSDYSFSNIGLILLAVIMGSGKTNYLFKNLLMIDTLGDKKRHSTPILFIITVLMQMKFTQLLKRK